MSPAASLPTTRMGLENAIVNNAYLSEYYERVGNHSIARFHANRADACEARLSCLEAGGVAA